MIERFPFDFKTNHKNRTRNVKMILFNVAVNFSYSLIERAKRQAGQRTVMDEDESHG